MTKLLEVQDLEVTFSTYLGDVHAVRGVNFTLNKGETLAIVGESGSGKSVTAKSLMKLLPKQAKIEKGHILFDGKDLTTLTEKQMKKLRGFHLSMVFQDPMTSLNPTMTIGKQILEGLNQHQKLNKKQAVERVIQLLSLVGLPSPEIRYKQYPHELSGGMRQRVVIAIALACDPQILIADEPTTALDVTIQAQILEVIKDAQNKLGMGIILITHDLGVVANMATRVAVMYAGMVVEMGSVDELFMQSKHPYTWGLLASMPKINEETEQLIAIPGSPPDLMDPPKGCPFAARCPHTMEVCLAHMPKYTIQSDTHYAACWLQDARAERLEKSGAVLV